MKRAYTKYYADKVEAAAQALAASQEGLKVVMIGPVKIIKHRNSTGGMPEEPNPGDKDLWMIVATDSEIDTTHA